MKSLLIPVAQRVAFAGMALALLRSGLISSAAAQPQVLSVTLPFDAPRLERAGEYSRVTVADCETLQRVGAPLLPFRTVRLLLPPGGRVGKIEARLSQGASVVPGVWRVDYGRLPVNTPGLKARGSAAAAMDEPDPTIYESNQPYPSARAELASLQRMAGYVIAFLRLYPIQYAPTQGELVFAPELKVELTVDFDGSSLAKALVQPRAQERAKKRVATFVDNPELLKAYENAFQTDPAARLISYDYLLITRSNLVSAFQPLADLKTQAELSVKVETVEAITNAWPGLDAPEKLRNYIRDAYMNWGISYVLLGGDIDTAPCRYAYVNMGGLVDNPLLPCDLYFACLDGSWNSDGDARWGEPEDGEGGEALDLLGEVFVGRAPVDTPAEVGVFVEKTTRYETQSHPHVTNVLVMAEFLADTPSGPAQGGDMFDPLAPLFSACQVALLDDRPFTTPQWTKTNALDALNRAPHLVILNGHGNDETLIGVNYPFLRSIETSDLDALTNEWLFLANSVACNVGQFDNDRFSPDCVGEETIKRHSRGAFAAIFNSRVGWYDPLDEAKYSGEFQLKFFTNLLSLGHTNLGAAHQLGKHDLLSHVETSGIMTYRWCYYELTLFGDPHAAWKTPPEAPSDHQLIVASEHEGTSPPTGATVFAHGSFITCQVTNSPLADARAGWQYVCTGWSGTGSAPAFGSGTQVTFAITNDSVLTWRWMTQVWLAVEAENNGVAMASNGWYDLGASGVAVAAEPWPYYHFVQWLGDAPVGEETNPSLQLSMDWPRNLTAEFAANLTLWGTPEWWLANYGWTNEFEAADEEDTDSDGMAAWQEYVAGTCPTDLNSVLKIRLTPAETGCVMEWPSVSNRFYSVHWAANPAANFIPLTNGLPANPPRNTFRDSDTNAPMRVYRVRVGDSP